MHYRQKGKQLVEAKVCVNPLNLWVSSSIGRPAIRVSLQWNGVYLLCDVFAGLPLGLLSSPIRL